VAIGKYQVHEHISRRLFVDPNGEGVNDGTKKGLHFRVDGLQQSWPC